MQVVLLEGGPACDLGSVISAPLRGIERTTYHAPLSKMTFETEIYLTAALVRIIWAGIFRSMSTLWGRPAR